MQLLAAKFYSQDMFKFNIGFSLTKTIGEFSGNLLFYQVHILRKLKSLNLGYSFKLYSLFAKAAHLCICVQGEEWNSSGDNHNLFPIAFLFAVREFQFIIWSVWDAIIRRIVICLYYTLIVNQDKTLEPSNTFPEACNETFLSDG